MWWIKFAETAGLITGPFGLAGIVVAATLALNLKREERTLVEEFDDPLIGDADALSPILKQFKTDEGRVAALGKLLKSNQSTAEGVWANIKGKVDVERYLKRKQAARRIKYFGAIFILLGVLFYGAAITGKKIEVLAIEKKSHDLLIVFREAENKLNSALSIDQKAAAKAPKSVSSLSGIVSEEQLLLKAFNNGDGRGWELLSDTRTRSFDDVTKSRETYFSRLRSIYPEEADFWNQLVDAAAGVSDIAVRADILNESLDTKASDHSKLKDQAARIMDVVTHYKQFAQQDSISINEIYQALNKMHETGRENLGMESTRASNLRRDISDLATINLPAVISLLEEMSHK